MRESTIKPNISKNDIKRPIEELLYNEAYFKSLLENVSDVITVVDVDGTIRYVSPSCERILGYKNDEVIGKNIYDFVVLADKPLVREIFTQVIRDPGYIPQVEYRLLHSDGTWRMFEVTGRNLLENPIVQGMIVTYRDITERMKMEEEVHHSREFLSRVLDSIHEKIIVIDRNYKIIDANNYLVQECKAKREDIIGRPCYEVVYRSNYPCNEPNRLCPLRTILDTKSLVKLEHRHINEQGRSLIIEVNGSPILGLDGDVEYVVEVQQDITERKRMEEEVLRGQKLESVGILAGGIAHDFGNFLTAILGNVTLAKMDLKPGDESFEILARVERAALQARSLARQLLTLSKGGALIKKTTSISELTKDTTMLALRGSKVVCRFTIPNDLWLVDIDEGQISQVINNIVINARQAMSEGGIMQLGAKNTIVSPKQHLPLKEGRYVKISIEDQGMGIPDENLEKIFDPYFTTKGEGSGLGLSTSYSVVKRHNGHITVESKVGVGTTFNIYIPASDEMSAIAVDEEKALRGKGKILVMDDQRMVRDAVGSMLKRIGFENVEFATDGEKAIELYKKAMNSDEPFDVIIVDLTIPGGMGGQEAMQELRKMDPDVKAIVSSGYANAPIMSNYKKHGFCAVVAKPYTMSELSKVLLGVIADTEK
jgi:PAS domain S-box-containing protein